MLAMLQLAWILIFIIISDINAAVSQTDGDVDIEHPYVVSIRWDGRHVCSGAILDERHIITSDRCVPSIKHFFNIFFNRFVISGTHSLKLGSERTAIRETFSQNHYINPLNNPVTSGLGVIKLARPLQFGKKVQPILLSESEVPLGAKLQMVGWKMTDKQGKIIANLTKATLERIDLHECQPFHRKKITESEFCTQSKSDYCEGDRGSPLIYEGKLVGVATFGISCNDDPIPDVHPSIDKHLKYLKEVLKQ